MPSTPGTCHVDETPEEVWDRTSGVNLKGVFLMSKFAIPRIREGGWPGAIVNIASVQGLQSMPRVPAYSASKGGVLSLTQATWRSTMRAEGIRVNAICPGTIDSEMVRTVARTEGGDLEDNLRRLRRVPSARSDRAAVGHRGGGAVPGQSERARFITGEHLMRRWRVHGPGRLGRRVPEQGGYR